jgi:hypothetical protein
MKDLDIKSFYRHDIPINKTYKKKSNKNNEKNHTSVRIEDTIIKSKNKRESSKNIKGGGKNPEGDTTDEYIDKLIN